jgi:hypothetical protein
MTRYTVVWDPEVEAQFINAWIAGDSTIRAILTEIANWLDSQLAKDPESQGQLRSDLQARIIIVPLANSSGRVSATYQVLPDDRQVRIVRLVFKTAGDR